MNLCTSCGLDFSSVRAFATHRVGKHAFTHRQGQAMKPAREDGRRCLNQSELHAAGFVQNSRNRWGLLRDLERAHKRFSSNPAASKANPVPLDHG